MPLVESRTDRAGYSYTDEAYAIFPRYILDEAVLEQVETFDFDALPDVETLRAELVEIARTAGNQTAANDIQRRAAGEERAALVEAFAGCDLSKLSNDPMPYRRVLSTSEATRVREQAAVAWGVGDGVLYPMCERTHPSFVAFDLKYSDSKEFQADIMRFIAEQGVERVFEIREHGPSFESEPAAEDFAYNGAEGFWIPRSAEWIVYCSHEASITFGGSIAEMFRAPRYAGGLIGTQPGSWWKADG